MSRAIVFNCQLFNMLHFYRIKAENQFGAGPVTETDTVLIRSPIHPPGPPRNLEIFDIDKNSVTIQWTKPSRNGGANITGLI